MPIEDLSGKRFGNLTAQTRIGGPRNLWDCICDCGQSKKARAHSLKIGGTTHCGCKLLENMSACRIQHGMINTRQYTCWQNMKHRCTNPKSKQWHNYGGRGIKICDRWLESFENFWEDMKDGYAPNLTIERKDNDGNYTKKNCIWITKREQHQNKRTNHLLTVDGRTQNVRQWAIEKGITPETIHARLRLGWAVEDAVNTKPRGMGSRYLNRKGLNAYPA